MNNNLYKHTEGVALLCYFIAKALYPYDSRFQKDMYLLGMVHDFAKDVDYWEGGEEHNVRGEAALRQLNFPYAENVGNHGNPERLYKNEDLILNLADMLVMPSGNVVTFQTRLEDIKKRYGNESSQYINACKVVSILKDTFKSLRIPVCVKNKAGGVSLVKIELPLFDFNPNESELSIYKGDSDDVVKTLSVSSLKTLAAQDGVTFMRLYKNLIIENLREVTFNV